MRALTHGFRRARSRVTRLSCGLALLVAACASSTGYGGVRVHALHAGDSMFGTTSETQGTISISRGWTLVLTDHDVVFTRGDQTVVLESVVGSRPIEFRESRASGKLPDVAFELAGGVECRWRGTSVDVGNSHYELPGPGTFVIDDHGTMRRRS
jgi:hypothetical protein